MCIRDRDNIVGLAYVNVVCTGNRYNVLRDFTSNANFLRVMNSHEPVSYTHLNMYCLLITCML